MEDAPTEIADVSRTFHNMVRILNRDEAALEAAIDEKTVLLKEVHHRVKNNLQLIASIISMQGRLIEDDDAKRTLRSVQDRVASLASIYKNLYQAEHLESVDADRLISEVINQMTSASMGPGKRLKVDTKLEPLILQPDQAVPLTLLTNEAFTNAMKYAGIPPGHDEAGARVSLVRVDGDHAELKVTNSIGEKDLNIESTGLGGQLIEAFALQLDGEAVIETSETEFTLSLVFRIEEIRPLPIEDRNVVLTSAAREDRVTRCAGFPSAPAAAADQGADETETLGRSDLEVSAFSLGTMTFSSQTAEDDAHAQIEAALEASICPGLRRDVSVSGPRRDNRTLEEYIGSWLAGNGRHEVEIATKASGEGSAVRDGEGFSGKNLSRIVEGSLKRLQTDVIDLYQLHWPARGSYSFRQNWRYDPSGQSRASNLDHFEDVLRAMEDLVRAGKIRQFGLSNETAWGTIRWIDMAERLGAPRVVSVQNRYSLLQRLYDTDMAEVAVNEDVTLLSYSPLAAGLLTGKYQDDAVPEGSRVAVDLAHGGGGILGGRKTERAHGAVAAYLKLAEEHGIDPVHMALAWQRTRPFPVIPILGATSIDQLKHQLTGLETTLSDELKTAIDDVHRAWPMPY